MLKIWVWFVMWRWLYQRRLPALLSPGFLSVAMQLFSAALMTAPAKWFNTFGLAEQRPRTEYPRRLSEFRPQQPRHGGHDEIHYSHDQVSDGPHHGAGFCRGPKLTIDWRICCRCCWKCLLVTWQRPALHFYWPSKARPSYFALNRVGSLFMSRRLEQRPAGLAGAIKDGML